MKKNNSQTFIIEIKDTQHDSWQGSVTWVNEDKKKPFRSALELIRMMDSVIDKDIEEME